MVIVQTVLGPSDEPFFCFRIAEHVTGRFYSLCKLAPRDISTLMPPPTMIP